VSKETLYLLAKEHGDRGLTWREAAKEFKADPHSLCLVFKELLREKRVSAAYRQYRGPESIYQESVYFALDT